MTLDGHLHHVLLLYGGFRRYLYCDVIVRFERLLHGDKSCPESFTT